MNKVCNYTMFSNAIVIKFVCNTICYQMSKRLQKDFKDFKNEVKNLDGVDVELVNNNIRHWHAYLIGPKDTPYEDGKFKLDLIFKDDYPFVAPKVKFITPVYHCNIHNDGEICIDILKDNWSPAITAIQLMISLSSLLSDPNPRDPLRADLATLLINNKEQYNKNARKHTKANAFLNKTNK
jgi:ubiquitin-protein ligase